MKLRMLTLVFAFATVTLSAQVKKEWGAKFDYNQKDEQDPTNTCI